MQPDSGSVETLELPVECRAYLTALKDAGELAALRRVAEAGPGAWGVGNYYGENGERCLVGHAENWAESRLAHRIEVRGTMRVIAFMRFDDFAEEVGAEMAGKLCASFARALLEGPGK